MNPLRNGNDYYKKMLDLQERLRRSEEERIRLEERFSLLEHESRSRHETCINRLRMRYIEFLEEQQARDERNHRLLGALDRVDSSLALMSAKTDRRGALRKQYETSVLSGYNNNRANGSMTGDSGVASQNEEKQRRRISNAVGGSNKNFLPDRGNSVFGRDKTLSGTARPFSQVRSDPCYANWSASRYESSHMIHSPIGSARFPQSRASRIDKTSEPLTSRISSVNPASLVHTKSRIDRDTVLPHSSPAYDYRFKSSRFATPDYSLKRPERTSFSSDWRDAPARPVIRDLANSGAYDSCTVPSRSFNDSSAYSRDNFQSEQRKAAGVAAPSFAKIDPGKRLRSSVDYSGSLKDRLIQASNPAPYTRVTDILRQELGDEEEYVGSVVENELERYISKIRNLHREADPQSVEELDHEQNTSGDLLNVTLSDDGLDFSVEDKPRHRALPQHLGNVLALAKDLANRTATSANNLANNAYHEEAGDDLRGAGETGADEGLLGPHAPRNDKDSPNASKAVFQLTSVNAPLSGTGGHVGEGHDVSKAEFPLLAKNGISDEVAKASSELAPRPRRNIEDVAKSARNSQEIRVSNNTETSRIHTNDSDDARLGIFEREADQDVEDDRDKLLMADAAGLRKLDDAYRLVIGEERQTDEDYLRDIAEDLEPWNISALERRVQEIILNDEAQADYIRRESDGAESSRLELAEEEEQAISDIHEKSYTDNQNVDDRIVGNETDEGNEIFKNETISGMEELVESNADDSNPKVKQDDDLSEAIAEQSISALNEEIAEETRAQEIVGETPDYEVTDAEKNYVNQEAESFAQGEYPQDSNPQYEYPENSEYQQDPNAQYQNYDPNNAQYEQDPNAAQYPYDDQQQYQPVYTEDPNAQKEYTEDPNQAAYLEGADQQYVEENDQGYAIDPNQQYAADANYEQYVVDPNQEYSASVDPQQFVQDQTYVQDESQAYPVPSSADYAYPEGQEYATAEVYEPNHAQLEPVDGQGYVEGQATAVAFESSQGNFDDDPSIRASGGDRQADEINESADTLSEAKIPQKEEVKKPKDVIKSLLDSDTESTIEKNVSNTESDFDFN